VRVTVVVLPEARLPPSAVEVTVELVASMAVMVTDWVSVIVTLLVVAIKLTVPAVVAVKVAV
jgi:hypothetical protein